MTAAGIVTTDTISRTTTIRGKVSVIMNPLAPITPVNVASVGISTNATMLTASDQDRASRITTAPATTTGTEQASAMPIICQRSGITPSTDSPCPTPFEASAGRQV